MSTVNFRSAITAELAKLRNNRRATILSIHEYKNNFNEISNFQICFRINYLEACKKAKHLLENYIPIPNEIQNKPYSIELLYQARQ